MKMKYKFNEKQHEEIKEARRANKDKRIEKRLEVLELRCEGKSQKEIVDKTGFHRSYVCSLIKKYFEEGLQAVVESHYGGNRRNMSFEEEAEFLEQFRHRSEQGQMLDIHEIENKYREKVGHDIGHAQVYCVLQRHGWRKIMPRSKHPKKASEKVIETSKKRSNRENENFQQWMWKSPFDVSG